MSQAATSSALAINGGAAVSATPIPFMKPQLTRADIDAAHAVLESGMLRAASRCAEFESRWSPMTGAQHAFTCSNGTTALQLALGALVKPGTDVIVPAWTFIATASMVVANGNTPIFCDALEDTFQIDPADIEAKITPNTSAIVCTHLYGMPVDIEAIEAIAKKHDLKVIYDAAQAHLATYNDTGIGAFGDACTYSFYATKNLGTGEGGMVTTNDDTTARTIGLLRSHGETDKYLHEMIGFNYRMNDITGAVGCSKLDRIEAETDARRRAADRYDAGFADIDGVIAPTRTAKADAVWHLYTLKLDLDMFNCSRDEFCAALNAEGVPTAVHYPRPTSHQPAFAQFGEPNVPVSEMLSTKVFCVPMHQALSEADTTAVLDAVRKVADAFRK